MIHAIPPETVKLTGTIASSLDHACASSLMCRKLDADQPAPAARF
ncbi:hypothetical protein RR42_m1938 [Cupriavidus basilensis]|uniref:Uncharacterized protein n=1 Tax=Cupriavidus basilensis TaxID=68895 RepID=A0A0C4Y8Q1_9BURK|nr:hypothetical protein RR42_m1938 [Cupriavidus basilensis]